ncbi:glycosyltransferase [Sphingomonas xanthus]|uniref:Glycosyltransferase n=1 Tax=Sphingomonas xanthus TaxID=2594473 RepID=A0A516IU94_9SPHN|nr:glycosyltransferase [Sphingomonas xanthus]QDP20440.1 glycosyltransferase [Sphingomonas xanthus]
MSAKTKEITVPAPQHLVTVIMASTLEDVGLLRRSCASILEQTHTNFELLLLIDGPVQGELIAELKRDLSDVRICVLYSAKRRGLARSLNILCRLAKGELIARMDDDDVAVPERLEWQVKAIAAGYDVVGGAIRLFSEDACENNQRVVPGWNFEKRPSPFALVFRHLIAHPAVMYRKSWILRHRYDRAWGRGQDRELWVRTIDDGRFHSVENVVLLYRRPLRLKRVQLANARNTSRVILKHWRKLSWQAPMLLLVSMVREVIYRLRAFQ